MPVSLVRPQAVTSGTAINGAVLDLQKIAGKGLCIDADIALTMGAGAVATDNILVECKVQHADTAGGSYTDHKVLANVTVPIITVGAHQKLVEWPRVNLEGAKRYVRVVFEITSVTTGGTISAIVSNVQGRLAAQRDRTQDDNYNQNGYASAYARITP
jgi:hypothetical protein